MSAEDAPLRTYPSEGLPDEGRLASFRRATGWLNSAPLERDHLLGRVVLVDFWTYTCVNWLRTLPYLRAWHHKYAGAGLVVVGVHTPEFGFESNPANVATHVRELGIEYPVAIDADYGIWEDFANEYWPALYVSDAQGRIRFHHYGEGEYAGTEVVIQRLLAHPGAAFVDTGLVAPGSTGLEVAADWTSLRSPETYLGYGQSSGFTRDDPQLYDRAHVYSGGGRLPLNSWSLTGEWTVARHAAILNAAGGRIAFEFHARDVNLVMAPGGGGVGAPFQVFLDGSPVRDGHGTDVDADGRGVLGAAGTYQLVRQAGEITSRLFEIEFLDAGVEAYCFTFG